MNTRQKEMIEKFQCPGCVCGMDTSCVKFYEDKAWNYFCCEKHVPGTRINLAFSIMLGMPKGFNKVSEAHMAYNVSDRRRNEADRIMHVRLSLKETPQVWDNLNVPVWAMEKDGYLFVRTFIPRVGLHFVDVIEGGSLAMVPNAINVAEFIDEID